jgi:galactokinase
MTVPALDAQLVAAGFDEADAPGRVGLLRLVIEQHRHVFQVVPRHAWFVPGRLEVFGKHTDYAGGRSLVAAVPRGFAVVASPRQDRRVRVLDARWHDQVIVDLDDDARRFTGWSNYVAVVARRLAGNFPGASLGSDLTVASDLPRAAGVSSSSAFVVGVASALIALGDLSLRPEWRASIQSQLDLSNYLGGVENGFAFRGLAGTSGVGTYGGSEDHTAILNGRAGRVSAYSYVPVRHLRDEVVPDDWRFVIMASGVHADKAGAVRDRYNRASLMTRALLDRWNAAHATTAPTLAAILAQAPAAADELRDLTQAGVPPFSGADLDRRLRHFIGEDGRVMAAADAVGKADLEAIGGLALQSQADAHELLGNQTPETDVLARLAGTCGAFAASSFGAGFGGSVWALVSRDDVDRFAAAWLNAYRAHFPATGRVEWFATRTAPGVTALSLSE